MQCKIIIRNLLLFAFTLLLVNSFSFTQAPYNYIQYGPYSIGFQSHYAIDYSRPARTSNESGRLLQINLWYPTKDVKRERMDYVKYISISNIKDSARNWKNNREAIDNYLKEPIAEGADIASWNNFLSTVKSMKAYKNATILNVPFVVFLMHGNTADYSLMGEYLASKGLIVVNVPTKGYWQHDLEVNAVGMETQVRDNEFALQFLQQHFNIIPKKAAAVGMSFGGQSALGWAIRNPLIKCVVSLDGGIGSNFGGQLLAGSPFYNTEFITMPILHLYNPNDPGGSLRWFDEYKYADRFLISFKNMIHAYFLSYGHLSNSITKIRGNAAIAGNNYEAILEFTATFISQAFGDSFNPEIIQELHNEKSWIKEGLDKVEYMKSEPAPLRLTFLNNIYAEQGMAGLKRVYQLAKQKTNQPISINSYRNLFQFIFNKGDSAGLIKIAQLLEQDYPNAALAFYYRGRSLQLAGKQEEGKSFLKKALDLLSADIYLTTGEKETFRIRIIEFLK